MEKSASLKKKLSSKRTLAKTFWTDEIEQLPDNIEFESFVSVKKSTKIIKEYSVKWLGFKFPVLYFADRNKDKGIKCINLHLATYKLYDQQLKKSKHPFKMILRRDSISVEFFFHDRTLVNQWINRLRGLCVMCDFTSKFSMGTMANKGPLAVVSWVQNRDSKEQYGAKLYSFPVDNNNQNDDQAMIEKQVVLNEIKALRSIDHPNIVKLKEVHELNGVIILITEFISGPSLLKHIISKGHLPEAEVAFIMESLLSSIQALHRKNILHRNLKPENIFLQYTPNGTELKITEFGFSCTTDPRDKTIWHVSQNICSKCGTPGYMAPEILANKYSTIAADIFSLGVILYTCLTGEAMFRGKTIEDIIYKNLEVSYSKVSMKWNSLSKNARDLIGKMTHKNATNRPSIDAILAHPFFTSSPKFELAPSWLSLNIPNPLLTVDSDRFRAGSKESIEDTMSLQKESSPDKSLGSVLQSLILPPSYSGLNKNGGLEVPEFYINTKDTLNQIKEFKDGIPNDIDPEELLKLMKSSLKFTPIKSSLAHLDKDQNTPRFNLKSQQVVIAETFGSAALAEENEFSQDVDLQFEKYYQKCYTFPRIQETPFRRQSLCNTISAGAKTQGDVEAIIQTLETSRKLPELHEPIRKMIEEKERILEDLSTDGFTKFSFSSFSKSKF